jgi:hypothetical protein
MNIFLWVLQVLLDVHTAIGAVRQVDAEAFQLKQSH